MAEDNKDLFAPPTESELKKVKGSDSSDLFAPPTKDELNPAKYASLNDAISDIPVVGKPIRALKEGVEDLQQGVMNGATNGLYNNAKAGVKAAATTATSSAEPEQSKLDQLIANYKKYKDLEDKNTAQAAIRSPVFSGAGNLVGKVGQGMGAFAVPETLAGKLIAGGAVGGAEGAAESPDTVSDNPTQVAKDAGIGALKGAGGTLLGETVVAPALGKAGEGIANYLKDKAGAKQLAATVVNASQGGTLFGEKGAQEVEQGARDLSASAARDFTAPISEKNQDFTNAFQTAAEAGKTVQPSSQLLQSTQDFVSAANNENLRIPSTVAQAMTDLQNGSLTPDKANAAIQQIKALGYNNPTSGPLNNSMANFIGDLTNATNQTLDNTTLQGLNTNKAAAWSAIEPMIQRANTVVAEGDQLAKSASSMSPDALRAKVNNFIYNTVENAGKSSEQGIKARTDISELKNTIDNIQDKVPLGIDTDDLMKKIQNLGYLKAASKNVSGIRDSGNGEMGLSGISNIVNKVTTVPERIAEKVAKYPAAQNVARQVLGMDPSEEINTGTATRKLLDGNKDTLSRAADALNQNPATAHLGQSLADPENKNINATIFTIMQNPTAKQQLGITEKDKNQ